MNAPALLEVWGDESPIQFGFFGGVNGLARYFGGPGAGEPQRTQIYPARENPKKLSIKPASGSGGPAAMAGAGLGTS